MFDAGGINELCDSIGAGFTNEVDASIAVLEVSSHGVANCCSVRSNAGSNDGSKLYSESHWKFRSNVSVGIDFGDMGDDSGVTSTLALFFPLPVGLGWGLGWVGAGIESGIMGGDSGATAFFFPLPVGLGLGLGWVGAGIES